MNGKQRIRRIEYSRIFLRHLSKLPQEVIERAQKKEDVFKVSPFHPSLDTHKLHGRDRESWAFSVTDSYRIKFVFLNDSEVLFMDIGTHEIYR